MDPLSGSVREYSNNDNCVLNGAVAKMNICFAFSNSQFLRDFFFTKKELQLVTQLERTLKNQQE